MYADLTCETRLNSQALTIRGARTLLPVANLLNYKFVVRGREGESEGESEGGRRG